MKKVVALLLIFAVVFPLNLSPVNANANIYREFYVDINNGSDSNSGAIGAPFKTIQKAVDAVRKINSDMTGNIIVNIASGRYELTQSIDYTLEDSGKNGYHVIYRGIGESKPVISGAKTISGFTADANGIWSAAVDAEAIRDLSVNGVMAQRAKTENKIYGIGPYNPTYDNEGKMTSMDGIYVSKSDLGLYRNPSDIEFKWDFAHACANIKVVDIRQDPENEKQVIVEFKKNIWNSVCIKSDNNIFGAPSSPGWQVAFSVENAYELMDKPGEFYFDKIAKKLYYFPREGESIDTAEVLCPQIDKLITVGGRGYFNKLTNLSFENIKFAHTSWDYLNDYSMYFYQAESPMVTYAPENLTPGAFEVNWSDGLSITNCDFYGIGTAALKLHDGVINSTIKGNTFSDIGSGAIIVGTKQHSSFSAPNSVLSGNANVFFKKGWSSSSEPDLVAQIINYQFGNESAGSSRTWTNEYEMEQNPNALSWVKADLGKPYDISQIKMEFKNTTMDSHVFTTTEKSNFEVLVSNDKSFKTYEKVKEYKTNTLSNLTINENLSEKYRYVMFRKTVAEPFAITCFWVYSGDEERCGSYKMGLCSNNLISNNYITRIGRLHTGAPAITAYYTDGIVIDHNEIKDVPYSGISLGWGWSSTNETAQNNIISNNYISDYMLMCNDGGGIYVLGTNPGTSINGNYFKDGLNGYGALYFDTGSVGFSANNNVADNTSAAIFQIDNSYSKNITIKNTYATFGDIEPYKGKVSAEDPNYTRTKALIANGVNTYADDLIVMQPNNYLPDAYEIVLNAGIQPEYAYIKNNVPSNGDSLYKGPYASYGNGRKSQRQYADFTNGNKRSYLYQAQLMYIYENGVFGTEKWQYPIEYKEYIQKILNRVCEPYNFKSLENTTPSGYWCRGAHIDEMYMMKALIEKLEESVQHLSVDEMIRLCNQYLSAAEEGNEFGKYQSGAVSELQAAVDSVNAMKKDTVLEQYKAVYTLENAVNKFKSKKYSDEVVGAYASGCKANIDTKTKVVTVSLPFGADISSFNMQFTGIGNTEISIDDNIVLNKQLKLKCYNSDINKTSDSWKIYLKYGELTPRQISGISGNSDNWFNSNDNVELKSSDNTIRFYPWLYPYMYKIPSNSKISFSVKADRCDYDFGISFILSAKVCGDLEYDGKKEYKNTYYMLSLIEQKIVLYRVQSGQQTLVESIDDVGFNYGDYNNFCFDVNSVGGNDFITLNINGKMIFDNVSAGNIGSEGYFGILTKSVPIDIKSGAYLELNLTSDKSYADVTAHINEGSAYKLITAFYDENGVLVSIESDNVSKSGNYRYFVPKKVKKVAAYLVDSENIMKPICNKEEKLK